MDIEDTFVEISKDGVQWFAVGKVFGSTAGVDIDAFGFTVADLFAFVRLRDDPCWTRRSAPAWAQTSMRGARSARWPSPSRAPGR